MTTKPVSTATQITDLLRLLGPNVYLHCTVTALIEIVRDTAPRDADMAKRYEQLARRLEQLANDRLWD